jgi:hypothetical protein
MLVAGQIVNPAPTFFLKYPYVGAGLIPARYLYKTRSGVARAAQAPASRDAPSFIKMTEFLNFSHFSSLLTLAHLLL